MYVYCVLNSSCVIPPCLKVSIVCCSRTVFGGSNCLCGIDVIRLDGSASIVRRRLVESGIRVDMPSSSNSSGSSRCVVASCGIVEVRSEPYLVSSAQRSFVVDVSVDLSAL